MGSYGKRQGVRVTSQPVQVISRTLYKLPFVRGPSPSHKNGYKMERTPGQLLSLTSHLFFNNGPSPFIEGHLLKTPEIQRDHPPFRDKSFQMDMSNDLIVGLSPPNSADASISKIFKFAELDSDFG